MNSTSETTDSCNININEEEELWYTYAYQLLNSCTLPLAMNVIAKIGVLQIIHDHESDGGISPTEIATRIKSTNPDAPSMLDRMLQLLATYSVVRCTVVHPIDGGIERRYSPSPVTKFFVPNRDSLSLAPLLNLRNDQVFLQSWSKVDDAILRGGIPFDMVHGMNLFEYAGVDPRFNDVLNNGMYQSTTIEMKKILEKYKGFENINRLVDVGGGFGHALGVIASKYPSIQGINFDLPHVMEHALPFPGVTHTSGDMFEFIPNADAIFLKWVLHDWGNEHCLEILRNCYKALPDENGKVIVVEAIMDDEALSTNSSRATCQMDVHMMVQCPRGKERIRREFEYLAKSAGYSSLNFDCCTSNVWVMEFYK